MATTEHFYTGNGSTTTFAFTFPYLSNDAVKIELDNVLKTENSSGQTNNDYTISNTNIVFNSAPGSGVNIHIYRNTNVDSAQAQYAAGSSIRAADLNNNQTQLLYAAQEENQQIKTTGIQDGAVTSTKIEDGTIVNADINGSAAIEGSKLQASSGSVAGSMSSANFTKLAGIETAATADQTAAEIRTLVESASDSNVFTDADHTKLNGIETSATADQTAAEIRTLVEAASDSNVFTDADHTKLNAIETNADVTDATNVNAAGAVMNSDLATKGQILVGDGSGDPTVLGVGTNNHVLVADSNEASGVKWAAVPAGSGLSNIVEDTTPQLGGNLDVQASEINTSTTNGNIKLTPDGTGKVEVKGNTNAGSIQLNCENNSHGVTLKGPAHSAAASYTLTLPTSITNDGLLTTDTNGNLSWFSNYVASTGGTFSGMIYAFGGIELSTSDEIIFDTDSSNTYKIKFKGPTTLTKDSTFTLPEDGTNGQFLKTNGSGVLSFGTVDLTALSASNLTSGTIPDARFPATLPAASAANLTAIPAANITGTLPAISGANLTGIDAGATGAGNDKIFWENGQTVTTSYTIGTTFGAACNAMSAGPITINNSVVVTVDSGDTWTII